MKDTVPGIFLIESSRRDQELLPLRERFALEEVLSSSGRRLQCHYIRTFKELVELVKEFDESRFRYLHISSHGNRERIALTYDTVALPDLASLLAPVMGHRRLFLSACKSTRHALATPLFRTSSCYSVIGPRGNVRFHDAVLAWALFYSLMSKANRKVMKREMIERRLQSVCDVLDVSFNGFFNNDGKAELKVFRPSIVTD